MQRGCIFRPRSEKPVIRRGPHLTAATTPSPHGRTRGVSLESVIAELNLVLRGWFGYFKQARPSSFSDIDKMIRRRLRSFLLKQDQRVHFGRSIEVNKRWPNAVFANAARKSS